MEYRPQTVRQREFGLRLADGLLLALLFWGGVALRFGDLKAENPAYFDHYLRLAEWLGIFGSCSAGLGSPTASMPGSSSEPYLLALYAKRACCSH